MPPVIPLLVKAAPYIMGFVASMLASVVLGKIFAEDVPGMSQDSMGIQANKQSMKAVIPVIYGETRIGINRAFVSTSGADSKYLHIIGIIGEGEIEGFSDQVDGVDPVYLDNKLYTEFGANNVSFELFTGTATQTVCTDMQTYTSDWTDPLRYTAYIYVQLKFDANKFQHIPNITIGVKGTKIYNPYSEVTEYTNNPALCVYDLMTRASVRGGFGITGSRIDTNSIEDARSYCATKGWTCNMPISSNLSITDNIQLLLNNFRGNIIKSMSKFYLKFKDLNEESVSMAFDIDNPRDVVAGSLSAKQPDLFKVPKAVNIEYLSDSGGNSGENTYKTHNYIHADAESDTDDAYSELKVKCLGLSDLDMVQQMAYYFLERSKLNKTCSFIAGQKAMSLDPLDLITLTHNLTGWDTKVFRVLSVALNLNNTVSLTCIEEHNDFYDDTYDPTIMEYHDTNLPDPTAEPVSVSGVSLSEEVYYYRNRSFTRLLLDFSAPDAEDDPFWDYAEIYMQIGSGGYKYMTKSGGDYLVDPVQEGDTYYFKIKSVNIFGNKNEDENDTIVSKTVVGKTTAPSNLTSMTAVANGDSVSIFADPISDPDIEGYEVRLGIAWDGAIFISFNKSCSLRLNGVRPGTHTFWMSPKDNAGNYSSTPVSATVKVFIPPGFTQLATYGSWAWDYEDEGIHKNTGHVVYAADASLECMHGLGVQKTAATAVWDEQFYSNSATSGSALVTFKSYDTTKSFLMGLNTDPTLDASYTSIDYSFCCAGTTIQIWESGSLISSHGTLNSDTVFTIEYDGTAGTVVYAVDGVTVRTVSSLGAALTFYLDSSFYTENAIAHSITFSTETTFTLSSGVIMNGTRLTGVWQSPTQDLNAIEDVRVWGDFLAVFVSGDNTWEGVAPNPTTWDDLDPDASLSWNEIFAPSSAGVIQATLLYKEGVGDAWSEADFFEIVCAEISARYIAVSITITDPSVDGKLYLKELNMSAYEGQQ